MPTPAKLNRTNHTGPTSTMPRCDRPILSLASALLFLASATHAWASDVRLYRWVDEQGNVFYSDRPDQQGSDHDRLNQSGIIVDRFRHDPDGDRHRRARSEQIKRQRHIDMILLNTYPDDLALLKSQDEQREPVMLAIRMHTRITNQRQEQWRQLNAGNGRQAESDRAKALLDKERETISDLERHIQQMNVRHHEELLRYRALAAETIQPGDIDHIHVDGVWVRRDQVDTAAHRTTH